MTRDDIVRMAREAFAVECIVDEDVPRLERFAALVAAAVREPLLKTHDAALEAAYEAGAADERDNAELRAAL